MDSVKSLNILRFRRNEIIEEEDIVVVEYPLKIFINGKAFISLLCTPKSLKDLTIGFLNSEGIINSKDDIEDVKIDEERGTAYVLTKNKDSYDFIGDKLCGKRTITTACGKGRTILYNVMDFLGTESEKIINSITVNPQEILSLINQFNKSSELFIKTGGVHSCALCSNSQIMLFEEDVGRHNALDKILGHAMLEDINLEDKLVATSGRISSEMIVKVIKRKIPILISRSAPTDTAVEMAEKFGLTLIGFARGEKMNIYTNSQRINLN